MADEKKTEETTELSDIEIAELANKELRKRDEEIASLKKELAKAKLYSEAEEEEKESLSREECISRLSDSRTTNYDYAEAVIGLVDDEIANGHENPLGAYGKEVYDFLKECLDECGDDKSRFTAVYQAKIGPDEPKSAVAYRKSIKR